MNTIHITHNSPNSHFPSFPILPMNTSNITHIESMIPLTRQYNVPRFITYKNGELIDQDGNLTTPEQHQTTHTEILSTISTQCLFCHISPDASFQQPLDTYIPIKPIPIKNETQPPFFLEQPKLVGTKREKVDLGLDNLPWVTDNSWNDIIMSATTFDKL